ncbi:TonB family protein [Variovorax paradoxus]|nr:TonB family protein [Variovorax paradoxus]
MADLIHQTHGYSCCEEVIGRESMRKGRCLARSKKVHMSVAGPALRLASPPMPRSPLSPVSALVLCAATVFGHVNAIAGERPPWASELRTQVAHFPELVKQVRPAYPRLAANAGLEGMVTVAILVGADGKPVKTAIRQRKPRFLDLFDEAARAAAMASEFNPARDARGEAVAAWVFQPFNFQMPQSKSARCKLETASHYPAEGRPMGIDAVIGIFVRVDEWGWPQKDGLAIVGRDPANVRIFDEPAKAAVLKTRCTPASYRGRDVDSHVVLDVAFTVPDSTNHVPATPEDIVPARTPEMR